MHTSASSCSSRFVQLTYEEIDKMKAENSVPGTTKFVNRFKLVGRFENDKLSTLTYDMKQWQNVKIELNCPLTFVFPVFLGVFLFQNPLFLTLVFSVFFGEILSFTVFDVRVLVCLLP